MGAPRNGRTAAGDVSELPSVAICGGAPLTGWVVVHYFMDIGLTVVHGCLLR